MMRRLLLFLPVFLSLTVIATAFTIHVPQDQPTIQAGLNSALGSDTVLVAPGTYYENIVWPAVNGIKLIGSGQEDCVIDGDSLASVIRFEEELGGIIDTTTLISSFAIQNGYAQGDPPYCYGGGIYCSSSSPALLNVAIANNLSSYFGRGGGFYCYNANPQLRDVIISNNLSPYSGGGFYCEGISSPSLMDVIISGNSAGYGGGARLRGGGNLLFVNVVITGNSAEVWGGGILCWDASLILTNVTISDNSAGTSGGGIQIHANDSAILENVTICGNTSEYGGGIVCSATSPVLADVTITGNTAAFFGGGAHFSQTPNTNLTDITIMGNTAYYYGGGIYCRQEAYLNLMGVTISCNHAYHGGGIYCDASTLDFSSENRCNIYSNTIVNGRGNGVDIFSIDCGVIDLIVDTFSVVTPTDYYACPIDSFTFDILSSVEEDVIDTDLYVAVNGDNNNDGTSPDSPFRTIRHALSRIAPGNTIHLAAGSYSPSTTGEIFPVQWSSDVSLSGSGQNETFLDAEHTGEGLWFEFVRDAIIQNLSITNGSADYGAGICCLNSSLCLENVTVQENISEWSGGGCWFWYSDIGLTNVTIKCNSAGTGGGISCVASNLNCENVFISGNTVSTAGGGGILYSFSNSVLVNVTICDNSATGYHGGALAFSNADAYMENCILWNNTPDEIIFSELYPSCSITISCSDIQGGEAGIDTTWGGTVYWLENNIDVDPLFCDPDNGDYRLQLDSPCRTVICGFMGYTGETCDGESVEDLVTAPFRFYVADAYPNPFNPATTIEYGLATPCEVSLSIYNIRGQLVDVIHNDFTPSGNHTATWTPSDLPSGIYIYQLKAGANAVSRRMVYVK